MKKNILLLITQLIFSTTFFNAQVQRTIEGQSIIRDNIVAHSEFNFFRDWTKVASFKSGIGESVAVFPVIFSTPDNKTTLHGLQLNAFVKKQMSSTTYISTNVSNFAKGFNKDFIYRSIFIDKEDVKRLITYIERDIIPNLKTTYKNQSKEYIYKCKEVFIAFLIDEKDLRITMHMVDFGPLGDGHGGGEQIEFWTESQVDKIPEFLSSIKEYYSKMK
jgi:hypothetical protein